MEFSEEYYETQNLPYTLAFGRETDAVKGLIFDQQFGVLVGLDGERRMQALGNILQTFNRDTIISIVLKNLYLSDFVMK